MAKEHDDWLAKLGTATGGLPKGGVKVGYDHKFGSVRKIPDGLALAGGYENKLAKHYVNLQCGPIPLLLALKLKYGVEGEAAAKGLTKGEREYELSVGAYVAGSVEFGPGKHTDAFTVHAFVGATLGAKATVKATHSESRGWDVAPVTLVVYGKGTVGARITCDIKGKELEVAAEAKLDELELLVVEASGWKNGQFASVTVREGKDVERIRQFFRDPGQKLEDAARWMVKSEEAKKIAAKTGEVLDDIHDATGVDVGQGVEDVVAKALGEKTRSERNAEQEAALRAEEALTAEFHALMERHRIGIGQPLMQWRSAAEWNKLTAELASDRHQIANGLPPQKRWVAMAEQLAELVFQRRKAAALQQSRESSAKSRDEWMKAVEAVRLKAEGNGNWLSQRVPADPKDPVHRLFEASRRVFLEGIALRSQAAVLEGDACEAAAKGAIAKFNQALAGYIRGQQLVKAAAAKQATPA